MLPLDSGQTWVWPHRQWPHRQGPTVRTGEPLFVSPMGSLVKRGCQNPGAHSTLLGLGWVRLARINERRPW